MDKCLVRPPEATLPKTTSVLPSGKRRPFLLEAVEIPSVARFIVEIRRGRDRGKVELVNGMSRFRATRFVKAFRPFTSSPKTKFLFYFLCTDTPRWNVNCPLPTGRFYPVRPPMATKAIITSPPPLFTLLEFVLHFVPPLEWLE